MLILFSGEAQEGVELRQDWELTWNLSSAFERTRSKLPRFRNWRCGVEWLNYTIIYCNNFKSKQFNLVHCGPLRSVAVRSGPLRSVAVRCGPLRSVAVRCGSLRSVAVRCGPLRSVAVRCGPLRSVVVRRGLVRSVAVCCGPLRSVAVHCSLLQSGEVRNKILMLIYFQVHSFPFRFNTTVFFIPSRNTSDVGDRFEESTWRHDDVGGRRGAPGLPRQERDDPDA